MRALWTAGLLLLSGSLVAFQPAPDFSGSWRLDPAQSAVVASAGFAGLIGAGAPPMIYITQPANGTLVVESPINEGHVRIYNPRGKTATPVGQGGTITMTSQWVGRTFVSQGTAVSASGASATVKEVFSLSADGKMLTIDVTTAGPAEAVSSLKYVRIAEVGPCDKWPTPCKRAP